MSGAGPAYAAKQELRALQKQLRKSTDEQERASGSAVICQTLLYLAQARAIRRIFAYYPLPGEVELYRLFDYARRRGIALALPRCEDGGKLVFYLAPDFAQLQQGPFGLREPSPSAAVAKADHSTLCVAPGLCFAQDGSRLGYGKGYYDRFLADFPGLCAGVCLDRHLLGPAATMPSDRFDRKTDLICTERRTVLCGIH